jgi:hypothetical protein
MNRNKEGFRHLQQKSPRISDGKIKEELFAKPEVQKLMNERTSDKIQKGLRRKRGKQTD